jgi:uncharacterized glyoxalase superfamily protein PhnB
MQPTPSDWPRLSVALFYDDPRVAIDWLCRAFGFSVRLIVDGPDGSVAHSELEYGTAVLMIAGTPAGPNPPNQAWRDRLQSPGQAGGKLTANVAIYVDDVDRHCQTAMQAGGEVVSEPSTVDYGAEYWSDRNYCVLDCEGHMWWFMQRISTKGQAHNPA